MTEVLIIGAGPAGSAAALRLARAGREVLLVDRCRFPRPKPCGEYYNPEAVRHLRELEVLPQVMAAGAREVGSLFLCSPGGRELRVPFAQIAPGLDPALSLGREELDHRLLEAARSAGVQVWEGALVREPLRDGERVTGACIEVDGQRREVRASLTLAADGLRSRFARQLGLARPAGRRRKLGLTARLPVRRDASERIEMHAGGLGCCGLAVRGGVANLGMVADASRAREIGGNPAAFFQKELARFPGLQQWVDGSPAGVQTVGPLTWRTQSQSTAGCLLLGDAGGFYDPFTGQGVTFALLTADLAAGIAAEALSEGDVSAARLEEYTRRRRRMLEPRLWVQQAIQAVVERPWLLERVLTNLNGRAETARTLLGVVADVVPARRAFSPLFLSRLFV